MIPIFVVFLTLNDFFCGFTRRVTWFCKGYDWIVLSLITRCVLVLKTRNKLKHQVLTYVFFSRVTVTTWHVT